MTESFLQALAQYPFSPLQWALVGFSAFVLGLSNLYFLSMRLSKTHFVGTAAWLFFFVNLAKLPFHVFSWKTVQMNSLAVNAVLLPFSLLGFFVGKKVLGLLNETSFRRVVIGLTAGSVLMILLG